MTLLTQFLLLGCLSLVPALAIQGYQAVALRGASEDAAQADALRTLTVVEGQLTRTVEGVHQTLTILGETMAVRQQDGQACHHLLERVLANGSSVDDINVTDRNGVVWCSSEATAMGLNLADRPYIQEAIANGGLAIGAQISRRINQRSALPFAVAYRTVDGAVGGTVAAVIDSETLAKILPATALPPRTSVTLADRFGVVLLSEPPLRQPGQMLDEFRRAALDGSHRGTIERRDADGIERLVAYSPVGEGVPGLFLSVGLDRANMLANAHLAAITGLGLLAFSVVAALALSTVAYRRLIHQPMVSIGAAAQRWRVGDYTARPTGARCREFRDLFAAFADMAKAVAEREDDHRARLTAEREANQTREILAIAMDAAAAGWWSWDVGRDVVTMSEGNARLLGLDSSATVHTLADWLATVHPDDRDRVKAARLRMHRIEYRVDHPSHGVIPKPLFSDLCSPLLSTNPTKGLSSRVGRMWRRKRP